MCKKLSILCLVLVVLGLSMPALADYIGFPDGCTNPLKVDISGRYGNTVTPGWQDWPIAVDNGNWVSPINKQFDNPLATDPWEYPIAQLEAYRKNQSPDNAGASRNRSGGFAFVAGTGEFGPNPTTQKGFGMNYLKLTLTQLAPNTSYRVLIWSFDAENVWSASTDNPKSKYGCWSTQNPKEWLDTHGYSGFNGEPNGYGPISQTVPPGPIADTNMPCDLKNVAKRISVMAPINDNNSYLGGPNYRAVFCDVDSGPYGTFSIYGWIDPTDWGGSMHMPIEGFLIVPEPATIALLGLGGLALLRRKRA